MKRTMLVLKLMLICILCLLCFSLLISCKKETTTIVQQSSTITGEDNGGSSAETLITGMGGLSGALIMTGAGGGSGGSLAAADADLKFSGHPEYNTKADSSGNVSILNILPGTYTIYAEATLPAVLAGARTGTQTQIQTRQIREDLPRMAQFKDIVISSTEATTLPETLLTEPGSISGTISLINNPSNVTLDAIMVFIPGTSYIAMTDDNGEFSMTGVPTGTYDYLRFSKDGLTTSDLYDIEVTSGNDTALDEVRMSLSTGPSGAIVSIEDADTTVTGISYPVLAQGTGNTIVTVNLRYDTRAVLMKVAHESSFLNVGWVPVANSYTFTEVNNPDAVDNFETDGTKYVYMKFADLNGLESSVYYQRFIIDNDEPTIDEENTTLLFGWGSIGTTGFHHVPIELTTADSGTGIKQAMICNNASFTDCSWQTYPLVVPEGEDYFEWDLGTSYSSGTKTVYMKVKDYLDRASDVVSKEIIAGDYTPMISSDENRSLKNQWGPYTFDENIVYTGDLTLEEGVVVVFYGGYTITVQGIFTVNGTSSSNVEFQRQISGQSFGGFILNTGRGGPHLINYLKMEEDQIEISANYQFRINGGTIQNSTLSAKNYLIQKTGTQALLVKNNTIDIKFQASQNGANNVENGSSMGSAILLSNGANIHIHHNNIALRTGTPSVLTRPAMYSANDLFSMDSIFSVATIEYNTITYDEYSHNSIRILDHSVGTLNFNNNSVTINSKIMSNDGGTKQKTVQPIYLASGGTGTVNVLRNNLAINFTSGDADVAGSYVAHYFIDSTNSATVDLGLSSTNYNYTGQYIITGGGVNQCGALNAIGGVGADSASRIQNCTNNASYQYCAHTAIAGSVLAGCKTSAYLTTGTGEECVGHLCVE